MDAVYTIRETSLGELLIAGDAQAVTHIVQDVDGFIQKHPRMAQAQSGSMVDKAGCVIRNYLSGVSTQLDFPYEAQGTTFQKAVWNLLSAIPYGETSSYTQIAMQLGKPSAYRAVANACGQNPLPIVIPCHRVLHKNGNVSGFAWGVEAKLHLLGLEGYEATALAA